ncbi:MAG: glycosyltransferase family 39 protein [Proteobacteria bacterium]|nr:glycosyltransferase family 39 protein [Pseudomonadota bacterium]
MGAKIVTKIVTHISTLGPAIWQAIRAASASRTSRVLVGCAVIAVAFDFVFFTGYYASDDREYLLAAHQMAGYAEDFTVGLASVRLGFSLPNALVYWLCDGTVIGLSWFMCCYHVALVFLAFFIGRLVHGETTGLVAAFLVAIHPLFYMYAGAILPDNATAVWLAIALLLLEVMRKRHRALPDQPSDKPIAPLTRLRFYGGAGLVLGLAYSCKEVGLVMAVPVAVVVIATNPRQPLRWLQNGGFAIAGLVFFIALEALLLRVLAEDWVSHLDVVDQHGGTFMEYAQRQGTMPWARLRFAMLQSIEPLVTHTGLLYLVALAVYLLLRHRSMGLILFCWWPFLYLTIGTTSLSSYVPPTIQNRYYAVAILPAAVMVAHVLRIAHAHISVRWQTLSSRHKLLPAAGFTVLCAIAATAVIYKEASHNLRYAGTIYLAPMVRGFEDAYWRVRNRHPEIPIVVSQGLRWRMAHWFLPTPPQDVYLGSQLWPEQRMPEPPYVFLEDVRYYRPDNYDQTWQTSTGNCARFLFETHASTSRYYTIRDALVGLFRISPAPRFGGSYRSSVAVLVEPRNQSACPPMPQQRQPVFPLVGHYGQIDLHFRANSSLITWDSGEAYYLQLFDDASYQQPPAHKNSRLQSPSQRIRIHVPFRTESAAPVKLVITGFGYTADGFVHRARSVDVGDPGDGWAEIELDSEDAIHSFRVRIAVIPGDAGVLELFETTAEPLT